MQPQSDESHAHRMIQTAVDQACVAIDDMDNAECVEFTRLIIESLHEASIIADPAEDPVTTAIQSFYAMELFRLSFLRAYQATDEHLKNVELLRRTFEL